MPYRCTNVARLSEMLDSAGCALILLMAEDEQADGSMHARIIFIHEGGCSPNEETHVRHLFIGDQAAEFIVEKRKASVKLDLGRDA